MTHPLQTFAAFEKTKRFLTASAAPKHMVHPDTFDSDVPLVLVSYAETPTRSHKLHLALELISAGHIDGDIDQDTELLIDTSGNTGISAAFAAQEFDLQFTAFVPVGTSEIKLDAIRAFGGKVIVVPRPDDPDITPLQACGDMLRAYQESCEHRTYHLQQFGPTPCTYSDEANIGRELLEATLAETGTAPTHAFMAVGTGQSLMSLARTLRQNDLKTHITLVDVPGGLYTPCNIGQPSAVEGLNAQFKPSCLSSGAFCCAITPSLDAMENARSALFAATGMHVGLSSGLVLAAALQSREKMMVSGEGGVLCCPLYDTGDFYGAPNTA